MPNSGKTMSLLADGSSSQGILTANDFFSVTFVGVFTDFVLLELVFAFEKFEANFLTAALFLLSDIEVQGVFLGEFLYMTGPSKGFQQKSFISANGSSMSRFESLKVCDLVYLDFLSTLARDGFFE